MYGEASTSGNTQSSWNVSDFLQVPEFNEATGLNVTKGLSRFRVGVFHGPLKTSLQHHLT